MKTYYVSYGTSFNPSAELYQLDNRSEKTDPEKSRNIEIGAKQELFEGDLSVRTSLSRSEKTNERNTDLGAPADAPFVLSGRRHTDALELEAIGRITPKWEAFMAVARMWANIDEALPGAGGTTTEDNRPINTPDYTFNLWNSYNFGGGWKIGGGLDGAGKRYGNATNLTEVPGYTRWDAMAQYETHNYTIKVNALNVFDTEYYESVYAGHTIPGAARTLQLTTEVKF
jgi:catecholate siderophore receptor